MRFKPPNTKEKLAINLTDTSKAYGYTLCVWGSGAVLISKFGMPDPLTVLLYVVGNVLGFGVLAVIVYGTLFVDVEDIKDETVLAATMIHLIAAPLTVVGAYLISLYLRPTWAFFVAGLNATISYNVMLLVESLIFHELRAIEQTLQIQQQLDPRHPRHRREEAGTDD